MRLCNFGNFGESVSDVVSRLLDEAERGRAFAGRQLEVTK